MTHSLVGKQWEKQREKKVREECGKGKPENNLLLLAPIPSLLLSLAIFVLHSNELCAVDLGFASGPDWGVRLTAVFTIAELGI